MQQKTVSHHLRKRFVKDFSLPFPLIESPYFEYFVGLYDPLFQTRYKWSLLLETLELLGSPDAFFDQFHHIKDQVIEHVTHQAAYHEFNGPEAAFLKMPYHMPVPRRELLIPEYHQQTFTSIFLKEPRFQVFQYFSSDLFQNATTMGEYLQTVTELPYFHISTQIRNLIFSNLNPKRQKRFAELLLNDLFQKLHYSIPFGEFISLNDREVLLRWDTQHVKIAQEILDKEPLNYTMEHFRLVQLHPTLPYFAKVSFESSTPPVFCQVPPHNFAQVYKHYRSKDLLKYDLCFAFEGQVAYFARSLYGDKRVSELG